MNVQELLAIPENNNIMAEAQDPHVMLLTQLINEQQQAREQQRQWREEEDLCKRINECDGSSAENLKAWLQELHTVPLQSRAAIMNKTARGTLLTVLQAFAQQHPNAQWEAVRNHIIQIFISQDPDAVMRHELDAIKRMPFESITIYNQRFRALADVAYPPAQRGHLHQEKLCQTYARSLNDEHACSRLARGGFPATLEQAMTRTQMADQEGDTYRTLMGRDKPTRPEQAMEVDAIASALAAKLALTPTAPQKLSTSAAPQPSLEVQQKNTEIAKLKAQIRELKESKAAPSPRRGAPASGPHGSQQSGWSRQPWSPRGGRNRQTGEQGLRCYSCGRIGHLARACRQNQPKN